MEHRPAGTGIVSLAALARNRSLAPPRAVLGYGAHVDCARSHVKRVDCATRTGEKGAKSAPIPPAHTLSTGPLGAPALRACPQAFHTLGRRLETATRSPHGPLPVEISISSRDTLVHDPEPHGRRLLRSGSHLKEIFGMN